MNLWIAFGIAGLCCAFAVGIFVLIGMSQGWFNTSYDDDSDSDSDSDSEEDDEDEPAHHDLGRRYYNPYVNRRPPVPAPPVPQGGAPPADAAPAAPAASPAQPAQVALDQQTPPPPAIPPGMKLVHFNRPPPPDKEEFNDIRWFRTKTLPVKLSNLGIQNCVECELMDAVVPRGDFILHSRNRTFQMRQPFEASVTTFTDISLPEGNYSASQIATMITNLAVAAGFTNFSASVSTPTQNFTFYDDSVVDVSFNTELAYDLGWGDTVNLNIGSAQFPVSSTASYTVATGSNTFSVAVSGGAFVEYTIAAGTYTASTLATAMDTAITSPASLTAAYVDDASAAIAIYYTGFEIDVQLGHGLAGVLGVSAEVINVPYSTSLSKNYSEGGRADLYGSRYVEIRTTELAAPTLHHRGVLQAMFLDNELTNWRNTGGDDLRRRRFATPISINQLTVSFEECHPVYVDDKDFRNMELNGLAVAFCICFRRLRYKVGGRDNELNQY